ncbi:MAG TPA: hypothetical protein VH186_38260 [Chloroflexia bacterium]|nr:hypothetical protein [Chloroflexia bacterium]
MAGFLRPRPPDPEKIPPHGVLIGRMIFIGGLVLALLGLAFLVMLGIAAGSLPALIVFSLVTLAGILLAVLAVRDLTGSPQQIEALVAAKTTLAEGGNSSYNLKLLPVNSAKALYYGVTALEYERFEPGDRVAVRYSAHFKLPVDIRLLEKSTPAQRRK